MEGGVSVPSLEAFDLLEHREARVLHALDFLAGEGGKVSVSQRALAKALHWRETSGVRRSLYALERHGLILAQRDNERGIPHTYTVTPLGRSVAENIEAMGAA